MFRYRTIAEKAAEWNIHPRQVQQLCRKGEIKGAEKRGGVWFIPAGAKQPVQPGNGFQLRGTKRKIFETAVNLFSRKSYETVTIKDIADEVGIGQSAVYNHFASKQEILDTIYRYFEHYFIADRPSIESLEPVILDGTLLEIITAVNYSFAREHEQLLIRSTAVVFQRAFIDPEAQKVFLENILNSGIEFASRYFERAVELGRLAPFDTATLAAICNMNRWRLFLNWLICQDDVFMRELLDSQHKTNELLAAKLVDLHAQSAVGEKST